jgi:hypothetical protein
MLFSTLAKIHRQNVKVKNADGKKHVEWDKKSTVKMSNGKKHRKEKTLNGWRQQDIRTKGMNAKRDKTLNSKKHRLELMSIILNANGTLCQMVKNVNRK